jgi:hypothetical protein
MRYMVLLLVLIAAFAWAEEIILQPGLTKGKDAFCWEQFPTSNYGVSYLLKIYTSDSPSQGFVSFIEFDDLMYYHDRYVNMATLCLYTQAVAGSGDVQFGASDAFWDEDRVTWQNMPDIHPDTLGTVAYPTINEEWWEVDVTEIVRGWLDNTLANHGFKLFDEGTGERGATFYASEYMVDEMLRPKLVLELSEENVEEVSFGRVKALYR